MANWDLYNSQLNCQGSNRRERAINQTQRSILKRSVRSPAYKTVLIDGEEQDVVITSRAELYQKKINALPNEHIYAGSIVEWNGRHWIITETDCEDDVYQRGLMFQCNVYLQWQKDDGTIIGRYGYSEDITQYATGVVDNKIFNSIQFALKIKFPMDEETVKLRRDRRFLLDVITDKPNAYILSNRNVLTENYLPQPVDEKYNFDGRGKVLMLTLTQTQLTQNDNEELMIADYFVPEAPVPIMNFCKIEHKGKPEVKLGGSFKTFSPVFYDSNHNIITDITPKWEVIVPPQYVDSFIVEYKDNNIRIKALDNPEIANSSILLKLSNEVNNSVYELYVKVVYLYG